MAIVKVDVFGDSFALVSDDGSRETIRRGVLSIFDPLGAILDSRDATEEDRARFLALASEFEASLAPIAAPIEEVEVKRNKIEVEYEGGAEEEIKGDRYKGKDDAGRTIIDREATPEDFARLDAAAAQSGLSFGDDDDDDHDDDSEDDDGGTGRRGEDRRGDDDRDRMDGTSDDDTLDGGAGRDRLRGDDGDDSLFGGEDSDDLRGGAGADSIFGGDGDDRARGDDGDDSLFGEAGNDRLKGKDGNDEVFGGDGDDRVIGNSGDDSLFGGADDDRVKGGGGNDSLSGDDGNDRLQGGDGDDTLDGGAGADRYNGGLGADTLIFAADGAAETVQRFGDGEDVMDISAFSLSGFDAVTAEQAGLDVLIDLGGGDTIRLQRFDLDDLDDSDFIF